MDPVCLHCSLMTDLMDENMRGEALWEVGANHAFLLNVLALTCFAEDSVQASTPGLFLREPFLPESHVSLSDCGTEVVGED